MKYWGNTGVLKGELSYRVALSRQVVVQNQDEIVESPIITS